MSCAQAENVVAYALGALPPGAAIEVEAHLPTCAACRTDLERMRPVVASFAAWPRDVVRPSPSLRARLSERIAAETGEKPVVPPRQWVEPEWANVAPGIWTRVLARDAERGLVSMLVRLEPGGEYPPHTHAAIEELHLLDGELWIDEHKLFPGDYNRAEPGTGDRRVYSETGCTCVLITSTNDVLG